MKHHNGDQQETTEPKGKFRGYLWVVVVAFLIFFVVTFRATNRLHQREAPWSERAKHTLRSLGSTQLAYQSTNRKMEYGSYQAFLEAGYLQEGYTLGNIIEQYSLTWEVVNISTVPTEDLPTGIISSFTIVAWPCVGNLQTFGITEEQVVRVYYPEHGNHLESISTWDLTL